MSPQCWLQTTVLSYSVQKRKLLFYWILGNKVEILFPANSSKYLFASDRPDWVQFSFQSYLVASGREMTIGLNRLGPNSGAEWPQNLTAWIGQTKSRILLLWVWVKIYLGNNNNNNKIYQMPTVTGKFQETF